MGILRSIVNTFLVQFPSLALGVSSGVLTARILGPSGKGALTVLQADAQLFLLFFGFSMSTATVYFVASKKMDVHTILGSSLCLLGLGTVLTSLIVLAAHTAPWSGLLVPAGYWTTLTSIYLIASFALHFAQATILAIFQGLQHFKWVNRLSLLANALNVLAIATVGYAGLTGLFRVQLDHVLAGTLVALAITTAVGIGILLRRTQGVPKPIIPSGSELRQFGSFLAKAHLANALQFLNYRLDVWFVQHYQGVAQLGLYSLAVNAAQLLWMISLPVSGILLPYLAANTQETVGSRLALASRLNFNVVAGVAGLAFISAGALFPLVYGDAFAGSVTSFRILLPGMLFSCATKIFVAYLLARNFVHVTLVASLVGAICTLVLDIWLIPIWGIIGASIATALSYLATFAYVYYRSAPLLGVRGRHYFALSRRDIVTLSEGIRAVLRYRGHGP